MLKKPVTPPNPLVEFNIRTNNNICSKYAALISIKGQHIEIGVHTFIDSNCTIDSYTFIGVNGSITKAVIGRYCSIGNNVTIGPGEHDSLAISTHVLFLDSDPYSELTKRDCIIGNDVWIGVDSIIKRGVVIGNGAIIGANSIVTKSVPPYAIVAGNPAKILRYRFDKSDIQKLLDSNWWDYELDQAKELVKRLKSDLLNAGSIKRID